MSLLSSQINCRRSLPDSLKREGPLSLSNDKDSHLNMPSKRRKTAPATLVPSALNATHTLTDDDTIDPVEKLLSLTSQDSDILLSMDDADSQLGYASSSSYSSVCSDGYASPLDETPSVPYNAAHYNISYNFSKVINDNLRSYYSSFRKSQMEIHNDHSLFSVLTKPRKAPPSFRRSMRLKSKQVPFFKNVNFNSSPQFGNKIEDYIDYKDETSEDASGDASGDSEQDDAPSSTPLSSPISSYKGKMSFHYRRQEGLNLSLTDDDSRYGLNDGLRFLNPRSIISGQASETIGAAKFMINEFFF